MIDTPPWLPGPMAAVRHAVRNDRPPYLDEIYETFRRLRAR
ncbi:hypothetical protein [Mycobacterium decipiens]|nr:hypothetical protein [Mycobacterium decipiens]